MVTETHWPQLDMCATTQLNVVYNATTQPGDANHDACDVVWGDGCFGATGAIAMTTQDKVGPGRCAAQVHLGSLLALVYRSQSTGYLILPSPHKISGRTQAFRW